VYVNQGGTNHNYHTQTCNLACTVLITNPIACQKLGQSNLFYRSKSPDKNNGHEQAFSSQLSLKAHWMFVITIIETGGILLITGLLLQQTHCRYTTV